MNYIEITINTVDEEMSDVVTAMLADFPFGSFDNDDSHVRAYITESEYKAYEAGITEYLGSTGCGYRLKTIEQQNWNQLWESNFEPIDVEGRCMIRAPFHQPAAVYGALGAAEAAGAGNGGAGNAGIAEAAGAVGSTGNGNAVAAGYETEVIIMPKMSFGTGHHATTYLMAAGIMECDLAGLSGLDMGSGTGVLAILAVKRGARHMDAIDIDPWAQENAIENIAFNGLECSESREYPYGAVGSVTPMLGDVSLTADRSYDFILANINRNIIVADMEAYVKALNKGGFVMFSGFLECDTDAIKLHAERAGLTCASTRSRNGWVMMRFNK